MDLDNTVKSMLVLGQSIEQGAMPTKSELQDLGLDCGVNRQSYDWWFSQIENLENSDLKALLKGVTYVERELQWAGGPVAGPIWIFLYMHGRKITIEEIDEITGWVIRNTINPSSPFGTTINNGAKNYSEYKKKCRENCIRIKQARRKKRKIDKVDEARHREAEARRLVRKEARALGHSHRRSPTRRELIKKLNEMPIRDQLVMVAYDEDYTPNFYPTRCASLADYTVIESLDDDVKLCLLEKLKGRQRGPWSRFKLRLLILTMPIRDRQPWRS